MDHIINSLEKYIEQCISEFELSDFSPPVDHNNLTQSFAKIFHKDNAYWQKPILKDSWSRWVFIHFKAFNGRNPSTPLLGMSFNQNTITLTLTEDLTHSELTDPNKQTQLKIYDIWLDHNKLLTPLTKLIKEGINKANASS